MDNPTISEAFKRHYRIWQCMYRIRLVEEKIATEYKKGEMRCPVHLSIGQECVPSVLAESIGKDDYVVSTHRGHAHFLAKGGNLHSMVAELYGKQSGCCGGKGGSMHLVDKSVSFMGTTAIVGNSIPLGVGLALSSELKCEQRISCIYLGDGAIEEGVFYESINFATVRNLPILFLCENNLYSVYSSLSERQPKNRKIYEMVGAMGIQSMHGDGNNPIETDKIISNAVTSIRNNKSPFFIEFSTYRWREHCGPDYDDHLNYRTTEEITHWKNRDPIALMEKWLSLENKDFINMATTYSKKVRAEIDKAFEMAQKDKFADPSFAFEGVYAIE